MKNAVVLWTGGKDCCLALHLAREEHFNINALVTFVPATNVEFRAHPQSEIREQARCMGLDIHFVKINEPYKQSYVEALTWVKASLGASIVITGDIDQVGGFPNWIEECSVGLDIEVIRPLWKRPREWIMNEIINRKIQAKITFLNHPSLPREWLHRIIDDQLLKEMKTISSDTEFDLAGENGEYHSMVVSAPVFEIGYCLRCFSET